MIETRKKKKSSLVKEHKQPMPKGQKIVLRVLIGFFAFIILFTFLSRAVASFTVPIVQTTTPSAQKLSFGTTADGQVKPRKSISLSLPAGYKIEDVAVREGQNVKTGDVLVTLDKESIEKALRTKELDYEQALLDEKISGVKSTPVDTGSDVSTAIQDKERALEDSQKSEDNKEQAILNAMEELQKAKDDLVSAEIALEEAKTTSYSDAVKKAAEKVDSLVKEKAELQAKTNQDLYIAKRSLDDAYQEYWKQEEFKTDEEGNTTYTPRDDKNLRRAEEDYNITVANAEKEIAKKQEEIDKAVQEYDEISKKSPEEYADVKTAEATVQTCKETIVTKERAVQTAIDARDAELATTERTVEDKDKAIAEKQIAEENARREKAASSEKDYLSERKTELSMEEKRTEIQDIKKLLESDVTLVAPCDGVIQKISVTTGDTSTEATALTMSDNKDGMLFVATLDTKECKYIKVGEDAQVTLSGESSAIKGAKIEAMNPLSGDNSGKTEISVTMPSDFEQVGVLATMKVDRETASYPITLPLNAINTDNSINYVFVLSEQETILGKQTVVERRNVTIAEKSSTIAAIVADGSITSEDKVITQSEKTLKAGDRVRIMSE